MRAQRAIKRLIDIVIAGGTLAMLSPILAVVALLVRLRLGRPVIFRQWRPGLEGKPFEVYKFRTMRTAHDDHGEPLPDADRLTRLGIMLRRTSLDEVPQLLNVLHGEMSLVGPRPLLMQYLDRYSPEQSRRHNVKPGITGLAQISGRNELPWEEKFSLDVWYADHWSLWLDLRILWGTVRYVLRQKGISHPGHATMDVFEGAGTGGDRDA